MTLTRSGIAAVAPMLVAALVTAPTAASAQQRSAARPNSLASLGIHGFSVVLVVGSLQGTAASSSESVPESAKKALADMKDFLPYKRYQLLDAAWMLCCLSPNADVSGRVRGPDERDYRYSVDPINVADGKLNIRFTIREIRESVSVPGVDASKLSDSVRLEHSRQLYEAIRERDEAEVVLRSAKQKFDVGMLPAPELESATLRSSRAAQRVEDLKRLTSGSDQHRVGGPGQNIIDSTFSISLGETVVVGTSRLNGDRALIAILTAAAKPAAAR
jgi:hypothetical protein